MLGSIFRHWLVQLSRGMVVHVSIQCVSCHAHIESSIRFAFTGSTAFYGCSRCLSQDWYTDNGMMYKTFDRVRMDRFAEWQNKTVGGVRW